MRKEFFKISSGLKNLIGKELITDQYIAVFELVKNSIDAGAKNITISFKDLKDPTTAKIRIIDDGKGMNHYDILNKWLFVAYSAKRDGTEDNDRKNFNHHEKVTQSKNYAGSKGVGRFSCDRLGNQLDLYTMKKGKKVEHVKTVWNEFDENSKKKFDDVPVFLDELESHSSIKESGTVIEITQLHDEWSRAELLRFKKLLEKLVNPFSTDSRNNIKIVIVALDEWEEDKRIIERSQKKAKKGLETQDLYYSLVNSEIDNQILKLLEIKTVNIRSRISSKGDKVVTSLYDEGQLIYEVTEQNESHLLKDISLNFFYLNRSAKYTFKRRMGVRAIEYGSIFVYKNAIRVYPIGEPEDDTFLLDRRKSQGHRRYLGTREIIGSIDIMGVQPNIKEITSRDGGLVKNIGSNQLNDYVMKNIKLLERYIVKVINWGVVFDEEDEDSRIIKPEDVKSQLEELVIKLADSKNVIDIQYDDELLDIVTKKAENSLSGRVSSLKEKAIKTNDSDLLTDVIETERQIGFMKSENEMLEDKTKKLNDQLDLRNRQVEILKNFSDNDSNELEELFHQTGINATTINDSISYYMENFKKADSIKYEDIVEFVEEISYEIRKIKQISDLVVKAGLTVSTNSETNSISDFIEEYINKYSKKINASIIDIKLNNSIDEFVIKYKPLEISMILDNIINNAIKAHANMITINIDRVSEEEISVKIANDGKPLSSKIDNPNSIFEKGITTTSGSGLGLFHVKHIINRMKHEIFVSKDEDNKFLIEWRVKK